MKKIIWLTGYCLLVLAVFRVSAQKITLESGTFSALRGVETLNVKYYYDNMSVGKFENENDYILKKVGEYNQRDPGSGDRWKESWFNDREARFHPRFEEEFNGLMLSKKVNLRISNSFNARYMLVVRTVFTEPGYNIGISRMNAYIDLEIYLIEADYPTQALGKLFVKNAPGRDAMGYDFDTGFRIQEAYAKGGKEIAYYIWKNYLK